MKETRELAAHAVKMLLRVHCLPEIKQLQLRTSHVHVTVCILYTTYVHVCPAMRRKRQLLRKKTFNKHAKKNGC